MTTIPAAIDARHMAADRAQRRHPFAVPFPPMPGRPATQAGHRVGAVTLIAIGAVAVLPALPVHAQSLSESQAQSESRSRSQSQQPEDSPRGSASSEPRRSSGQAQRTLAPVEVRASSLTATEGAGSYNAARTTIGKLPLQLKEVPQSITVITRDQLDDQQTTTLESALKGVTGVNVIRYDASGYYNEFYARGFASDSYQIDNVSLVSDANGIYTDLAVYDRIEVLRGPAGLYSGAGVPGVTVNLARKRALPTLQANAAVTIGRWSNRRVEADLTGPLIESGRIRGRLVAVDQRNDTFMRNVSGSKQMAYGSVEADVSDSTTLSLGAVWQDVDSILSRGLPTWSDGTLIPIPRSAMPVLSWNRQRLVTHDYFAQLEHRTRGEGRLNLTVRRSQRSNDAQFTDPSPPQADGWMTNLRSSAFARQDEDTTADLFFTTPVAWGARTHNLLVGLDWRSADAQTHYAPYPGPLTGALNLFDPDAHALPEPVFDRNTNISRTKLYTRGVYGQFRFKASDALTLVGGARWTWWQSAGISWGSNESYGVRSRFTPFAAALYELTPRLSAYTSYSEIFRAQSELTAQGEHIGPRTGAQVELGLKGDTAGKALQYSVALFRILERNRAQTDLLNEGFSVAGGRVRSQGLETQVQGRLGSQWQLMAGYAYTATRYLQDAELSGQTFNTLTPRHNLNLWTRYDLPAGALSGLDLGAGLRAVSKFSSGTGSTVVRAPGFVLVSLRAGYQINRNLALALNVNNLFDKTYWEKVSYPGRQNFYGEPRNVMLSLRASL